jgi:hypothetical protein
LRIEIILLSLSVTLHRYSNVMPNYTKLFNSIVTSTIWTEDDKTRIVWITMLAIADQNGEVQASIPGLARLAAVSISDAEIAISKFLGPDPYSRTPENDGRRIAKIDGGWELLNHAKYRRMASLAEAKEANSERQRRHRERNASVTHRNATVTPQTDKAEAKAEAEAEAKAEKKKQKHESGFAARSSNARPQSREEFDAFFRDLDLYPRDAEGIWNKFEGNGWTNGSREIFCWKSTVASWKSHGYMPSQKSPSDYEPEWPKAQSAAETAPEEEDDLMAKLLRHKEAEAREAAGDHPDYWTEDETQEREEAGCF